MIPYLREAQGIPNVRVDKENSLESLLIDITNDHLLICDLILRYSKRLRKQSLDSDKRCSSLRSNPRTMSPYIHNCNSLHTNTNYHMLLPIVLYIVRL